MARFEWGSKQNVVTLEQRMHADMGSEICTLISMQRLQMLASLAAAAPPTNASKSLASKRASKHCVSVPGEVQSSTTIRNRFMPLEKSSKLSPANHTQTIFLERSGAMTDAGLMSPKPEATVSTQVLIISRSHFHCWWQAQSRVWEGCEQMQCCTGTAVSW